MKIKPFSRGWVFWCPGCDEHHYVVTHTFDKNMEQPTFSPSVLVTGKQTIRTGDGEWDWVRGIDGKAIDKICHSFINNGKIQFLGDCTHSLANQTVDLPEYPEGKI